MPLCSTEEAIAEIRQGKMIILVDDEDRENEGDLTMAAEFVTPEAINSWPSSAVVSSACPCPAKWPTSCNCP